MKLSEEMKAVVKNAPMLSLVTINADNTPHPIIVGTKDVDGDNISLGIYKMEVTQKNLAANNKMCVTAAYMDGETPKGYRFEGTATVEGKKVTFAPDKADALI